MTGESDMKPTRLAVLAITFLLPALLTAQEGKKDIYADPQNLKVLPEDISSNELSNTMKGFALGLGVRCENCHVGEAGQPLDTFDFESDEKAMKRKARVMVRMLADINEDYVPQLNEIEDARRTEVRCVTCHRGRPQPKLIEDELDDQLLDSGIEAALTRYAELREEFYGSHSYDFSEFTLPMYVQGLAADEQLDAAIALLQLNVENFPESYYTQFVRAELNSAAGNTATALDAYARAIELNSRAAPFLEPKIEALKRE
jgi:tetratricopeptide (TPR) repeat protein